MQEHPSVQIFGEVLFDHFSDGCRILGGAPFNVAWHLQAFGMQPHFISRIGDDAAGREIEGKMAAWGMNRESLQIDRQHPTGSVQVRIENGEPSYEIVSNSAYDFISAENLALVPTQGVIYHGSLATRSATARATLETLKQRHQGQVFLDVNLRAPWWDRQSILHMLAEADWVKLNANELYELYPGQGMPLTTLMKQVCRDFNLQVLVVTQGEHGASACDKHLQCYSVEPAGGIDVVDTVGAGDAFAAVLILGISHNWPIQLSLQRAQAFASALVRKRGATVDSPEFYQPFCAQWGY